MLFDRVIHALSWILNSVKKENCFYVCVYMRINILLDHVKLCVCIDIYHFCISSPGYPVKACEKVEPHGPTVQCACMKEWSNPVSRICIISRKFISLLFVLWPMLSGHDELLEYGAASASHQVSVSCDKMLFIQTGGWGH